jgi:DinB superfamily
MRRPSADEYPVHYGTYIDLVPEAEILQPLEAQIAALRKAARNVASEQETFAYAPGKWTIRQVMGHLGDGERIFGFRACCFSRRDDGPLPGFDENRYVDNACFNDVALVDLVEELVDLRSANVRMLNVLRDDQWDLSGIANNRPITVRALAYVMVGHVRHHLNLLGDRYGIALRD